MAPRHSGQIVKLEDHPEPYVTPTALAKYWMVSRKQIYKQIDAGTLKAIKLGPRLLRIRTADAREFERVAKMGRAGGSQVSALAADSPPRHPPPRDRGTRRK